MSEQVQVYKHIEHSAQAERAVEELAETIRAEELSAAQAARELADLVSTAAGEWITRASFLIAA